MREIKFRGKRKDNGEWVSGYYYESKERGYIKIDKYELNESTFGGYGFTKQVEYEVLKDTVSLYTGKKDKNNKDLYQNDFYKRPELKTLRLVEWDGEGAGFIGVPIIGGVKKYDWSVVSWSLAGIEDCTYIGNLFDNPEMLGATK